MRTSGRMDEAIRFALTQKGQYEAQVLNERDGYIGPAPIPLVDYNRLVQAQSLGEHSIRREQLELALADMVISPELVNVLGPALNSRRPLLIYGHAGTGKSFYVTALTRFLMSIFMCLMPSRCRIPSFRCSTLFITGGGR
ncbi:hypothetical protein MBH78_19880 [Oceanimonas sp. NS1]|nr:hypothetical protein [Oceanimonas sp. NS1]